MTILQASPASSSANASSHSSSGSSFVISGRRSTTPLSSSQRVRYQVSKILRPFRREHVQVLEDQRLGDVDLDRPRRDPEQDHAAAVAGDAERVGDRARRARHLEDDVEAEPSCRSRNQPTVSGVSSTLTTALAPIFSARPSRNGVRVGAPITTRRPRPARSPIVNSPIGPQPSTATERPARSCSLVAKTALPNGSWSVAISGGSFVAVVPPDHRLGHGDVAREGAVAVDARGSACARTCARGRCGTGSRRRR